jgi:hypothetical protein
MPLESRTLTTKLYRPRITGDLEPRPRLLEGREEKRGRPLAAVSTPAGYGQSTLVRMWLEACDSLAPKILAQETRISGGYALWTRQAKTDMNCGCDTAR